MEYNFKVFMFSHELSSKIPIFHFISLSRSSLKFYSKQILCHISKKTAHMPNIWDILKICKLRTFNKLKQNCAKKLKLKNLVFLKFSLLEPLGYSVKMLIKNFPHPSFAEAHPEKFNSRLRNKVFYGQMGGKDLLKRKWKNLAELVTLECDGKDITPKLKELRVHAIVFLNIPSYGGGTHPWNKSGGQYEPSTDDGLIEVVGLTTYQLPLLQAGGHGTCIAQCRSAKIVTSKTIPMQVDGEACKVKPSVIEMTLLNKAVMLAKKKTGRTNVL